MSNYPVNLLKSVLAKNGDVTIPPLTAVQAGQGRFSQEEGWKEINSTPDADGGIAPFREDFNGVFNLLSQFALWFQQGGIMRWNSQLTYEVGNEVLHNNVKYRCKQQCTNIAPPNRTYWKNVDSNTPVGMYAFFGNLAGIQDKHPIFQGDTAPDTSWVLADGTNGTEDLRNKFVYGGDSATSSTGGATSVTLVVANLPSHSHGHTLGTAGAHQHERGTMNITGTCYTNNGDTGIDDVFTGSGAFTARNGSHNCAGGGRIWSTGWEGFSFNAADGWTGKTTQNGEHSHSLTINNTGGNQAFSILPPYIKKAWFMKVAE